MPGVNIIFPLYTPMLPDMSGAIFQRTEWGVALTLFTSKENLVLFAERSSTMNADNCVIGEMMNRDDLRSLLLHPSKRAETSEDFAVFFDPIAQDTGEYIGLTRQQLLDACG